MIPLQFILFWSGTSLSYLRYLTFKSLRHFHPNAKIYLFHSDRSNSKRNNWLHERQDFQKGIDGKNYIDDLMDLDVEIIKADYYGSPDWCPVFQSDIFRWEWMKENGGFYLDTDQIILKSFDSLPLESEFIYCRYMEKQCGDYLPIGVLGLEKGSPISDIAITMAKKIYTPENYNSSGPFMMRYAIGFMNLSNAFNAPYEYFYPVNSSADVWKIYNGDFNPSKGSYSVHWFGGHPNSQKFNKEYTEEFAKTSNDSISVFARENKIIY